MYLKPVEQTLYSATVHIKKAVHNDYNADYGVAKMSKLLKIIGLFCRI